MMLTVDSITGGNRERDLRTGFSIPMRLNVRGLYEFASKPVWGINYVRHENIGCTGIVLSNHGGRQLDGSRSGFDQLQKIVDAVGDRIDVMMDGGVQRGTHILKALSLGAKAVGLGRYYLYPLAAAGQAGVDRALTTLHAELRRDMQLMGCRSISELSTENLVRRATA